MVCTGERKVFSLALKSEIEGLRAGTIPNGRPLTGRPALKVPGVDSLPAGMSLSFNLVRNDSYAGDLEDWDFTNWVLQVYTPMGSVRHCRFGNTTDAQFHLFRTLTAGSVELVEYCDFVGRMGNGRVDSHIDGLVKTIRYNRFTNADGDYIKTVGDTTGQGQLIYRNYFGPPVNLPTTTPTEYNAATVYAEGAHVIDTVRGTKEAISKVAGNVGNLIPTGTTSDAFWNVLDPHSDAITVVQANGKVDIAENLFDFVDPPAPGRSTGLNNVLRLVRNNGQSVNYNTVICQNNVCRSDSGTLYPLHVFDNGLGNWTGPVTITGNWFDPGSTGQYYYPGSMSDVDVWSENRDASTNAVIT